MTRRSASPLRGIRVAVTRSRAKAGHLARLLSAHGVESRIYPAIRTLPIRNPSGWPGIRRRLPSYDWIVFTSAEGVGLFFRLLRRAGLGAADLASIRIAAIGPGTGSALVKAGRRPDFLPAAFVAEDLVSGMPRLRGSRILIPRAAKARQALPKGLARRGAKVTVLPLYRTVPDRRGLKAFRRAVLRGSIDAALFASSSAAEFALRALGKCGRAELKKGVTIASIGPVTSRTLARLGFRAAVQAKEYSLRGMAKALVRYYRKTK